MLATAFFSYISNVSFHRRSVATNRSRDPRPRRHRGRHGIASTSSINSSVLVGVPPTSVAMTHGAVQLQVPSAVPSQRNSNSSDEEERTATLPPIPTAASAVSVREPVGRRLPSPSSSASSSPLPDGDRMASSVMSSAIDQHHTSSIKRKNFDVITDLRNCFFFLVPPLSRRQRRAEESGSGVAFVTQMSSVPKLPSLNSSSVAVGDGIGTHWSSYAPLHSFQRAGALMRSRSSSLSGSSNVSDHDTVSDAGDDEKTDVPDDDSSASAEEIARSGIGSVHNATPLKRKPCRRRVDVFYGNRDFFPRGVN